MTIYTGPNKEVPGGAYVAKFVRVEGVLITTLPNGIAQEHSVLAEQDGLADRLREVRALNPSEVDGGFYTVKEGTIRVHNVSDSLELPSTIEARDKTGARFRELSEGFQVELGEFHPYS